MATGLDYAVNRYYDPAAGRFTQVDPIGINAGTLANPQSLNMYAYVANDPVNVVDPSGLKILKLQTTPVKNFPDGTDMGGGFVCIGHRAIGVGDEVVFTLPPGSLTGGKGLLPVSRGGGGSSMGESGGSSGSSGDNGAVKCERACDLAKAMFDPNRGPRPTTQIDMIAMGMLAMPVAVVASAKIFAVGAILESGFAITIGVRAIQIGTGIPWLRVLFGFMPYINWVLGGDPRFGGSPTAMQENLTSLGYSNAEMETFQLIQLIKPLILKNPGCGG